MSFLEKITAQLPLGKKQQEAEYFFALNIGLSNVTAAVWALYPQNIDILGQATLPYSDSEDLVDKAYKALDQSLGALEIEPQKILFGVPDAWSIDENLKEPYLKLLQKMLKEFDLQAVAYVTTTNAIAYLLQKQEGTPPTAILLGLGDFVEVTLVRGGKVVGTKLVKRSEQLFGDIEGALRQFTEVEVLPSKILVYPTKSDEDINKNRDELMSYPWMQRLSFLHFPKIDTLDTNITIESIILSAASEINPEVDFKRSFSTKKQSLVTPTAGQKQLSREKPLKDGDEEDSDLGFVRGDITEKTEESDSGKEGELASELGSKRKFARFSPQETLGLEDDNLMPPDLGEEETGREVVETSPLALAAETVKGITGNFTGLKGLKFGKMAGGKVFIALGIFALTLFAYLFFVKAAVIVFVEPRILEKTAEVIADPKATSVNEDKKIIPGSVIETTVTGSGKATATGTKQIGDPAKGKVTIYNMTNAQVSLAQGTTLTSGSGLKFTLDSSVQIASQSSSLGADLTTVITPGKSGAAGVTAAAIGPDSNLPASSDTNNGLSVGGYSKSSVVALITEALSGGTSKNVTVVTSDDQKKLQAQVVGELRQKAEADLQGKMTEGKKIISDALIVVDGKYSFNKQVNDQANEFSLSATVRFKGTAYSDTDLRTIVSKLVETNIPEGYQLNLQDTETKADVSRVEKDGRLIFKATFKAKMLPKFNTESLREQMKGQSASDAVSKLKELENIVGAEITFTPNLPGPLARLPFLSNNITVAVSPK